MIVFKNDGIIEEEAFKVFGVNAKETESPIGYFGTGLKYAIAILLRHGQKISITSGGKTYDFEKRDESFRNKEFSFIYCNGEKLGYTTELGKNWELWQAYRELYCNARDEKNWEVVRETGFKIAKADENTAINVWGAAFDELFDKTEHFFIQGKNWQDRLIYQNSYVEVYKKDESFPGIYYKGILAAMNSGLKYTYNILGSERLTEDRTFKRDIDSILSERLVTITDAKMLRKIFVKDSSLLDKQKGEPFLYLSTWGINHSSAFEQLALKVYLNNLFEYNSYLITIGEKLAKEKGLKNHNFEEVDKLPVSEAEIYEESLKIVTHQYPRIANYRIKVLKDMGKGVYGSIDKNDDSVLICTKCFLKGKDFLVATIIEEFFHLETGYKDLTRDFQNHIFENLSKLVIEKYNTKSRKLFKKILKGD